MSAGHIHKKHNLTSSELDDLLDHALADPKIKKHLAKPCVTVITKDIPLLGSSSIGTRNIYFDQHFRFRDWKLGVIPVGGRKLDTRIGLLRHEKLEPALEDVYGWPYDTLAHPVAQHWEERDYMAKGFDPKLVEKAFQPFIRADEREPLKNVPTDLDLRPMLEDEKLLERTKRDQNSQKLDHDKVGYVDQSRFKVRRCELCEMYIEPKYGGPGCTLVKDINAAGYCRRFERGKLDS